MLNKTKGLIALAVPFTTLILATLVVVGLNAVLPPNGGGGTSDGLGVGVAFIMGILGLLCFVGILGGIPLSIYWFRQKDNVQISTSDSVYSNLDQEQIWYIHAWSWSAFWATPIWALGNKLYLDTLFSLIPLVGFFISVNLAFRGRQKSWEKSNWNSFEQFKQRQRTLAYTIAVFVTLIIIANILSGNTN